MVKETLGIRLKKQRVAYGLSQNELAQKIQLTRQTISKWENDRSLPNIMDLIFLADLYQVSLDQLVGREEAKPFFFLLMKQQIKRRERERMLEKEARKVLMGGVVAFILCFVWIGLETLKYGLPTRVDDSYIQVYGVKDVAYKETLSDGIYEAKVAKLVMRDGREIEGPLTKEKIREHELLKLNKFMTREERLAPDLTAIRRDALE